MKYIPYFIYDYELEKVGVTKEQIAKLFHLDCDDHIVNIEEKDDYINIMTWIDADEYNDYDIDFARSFF